MEILLTKGPEGILFPSDETEAEKVKTFAMGEIVRAEVKRMRNPMFHRKFMAMLRIGFDAFEVPEGTEYKGYPVQKEFEQFREDVTIAAGYCNVFYRIDGSYRVKAKSISFAKMKQDEFEQLYSNVANVLLQKILKNYTRLDLDEVVHRVLGFC